MEILSCGTFIQGDSELVSVEIFDIHSDFGLKKKK